MEVPRCFVLVLLLPVIISAFSADQKKSLDEFIRTVMECRKVTGVSVALVTKREIVHTAGYGIANVETGEKMTENTLINLASLTKSFTTTLAADAVSQGLTDWDTPIRKLLGPRFKLQNEFRTKRTSLRDLLSHRLGMPSYYGLSQAVLNMTLEQLVHRLQYFPVLDQFRSRYIYCNYLYVLAAIVLQRATGNSWGNAIVNNIFKPLGMDSSRVVSHMTDTELDNMAYSCSVLNNTCKQNKERLLLPVLIHAQPAGGLFSTARDMAKWMQFHLKHGKNDEGLQIVGRYDLRETYKPHIVLQRSGITRSRFPVENLDFTYALGWMNGVYRGLKKLSHTGAFSGYRLLQTLLPGEGVGVWVAITSFTPGHQTIVRDIITMFSLDLLLGKDPWLGVFTACTYPEPWGRFHSKKVTTPSRLPEVNLDPDFINVTEYIGQFYHKGFGKFEIYARNGTLKFKFGMLYKGVLLPSVSRDLMFQQPEPPYEMSRDTQHGKPLYFLRDSNGHIRAIRVPFLEPTIKPEFVKDDPDAVYIHEGPARQGEISSAGVAMETSYILVILLIAATFKD